MVQIWVTEKGQDMQDRKRQDKQDNGQVILVQLLSFASSCLFCRLRSCISCNFYRISKLLKPFRCGINFFFLNLFFPILVFSDEDLSKRIHTHLFIHDPMTAVSEARELYKEYPDSVDLQFALIRALCEKGEDVEAIDVWKKIHINYPKDEKNTRNAQLGCFEKK